MPFGAIRDWLRHELSTFVPIASEEDTEARRQEIRADIEENMMLPESSSNETRSTNVYRMYNGAKKIVTDLHSEKIDHRASQENKDKERYEREAGYNERRY